MSGRLITHATASAAATATTDNSNKNWKSLKSRFQSVV